ncbi:hypothetical protein [Aeromonas phage phiWae15]|nr:hypothetical protein [Aeromonas phage phiWae15]
MTDMTMLPVSTGDSGWGAGGAAALGAFVGSWFGNGWGPGGRGVGAGVVAADALSTAPILEAVNNVGMQVVQGQNGTNMALSSGLSSVYTGLNAGITDLGFQTLQSQATQTNALTQGFAGLNTAIVSSSNDTRFALQAGLNSLQAQNAECCCEIRTAIASEGAATRQLIQQNLITELQTQLCDSKSKNAQLESQIFLQGSQAAQTQQIIQTVLAHLPQK